MTAPVDMVEVLARLEIQEAMGRYVHLIDRGRTAEVPGLFAPDGILHPHGLDKCHGREAIAGFLQSSRESRGAGPAVGRIRHHVSSVLIELESPTAALARSYFIAMNSRGPDHWGVYRDRWTCHGGRWMLGHRSVTIEGAVPDGWIGGGSGPVKFIPERDAPDLAKKVYSSTGSVPRDRR